MLLLSSMHVDTNSSCVRKKIAIKISEELFLLFLISGRLSKKETFQFSFLLGILKIERSIVRK